MRSKFDQLARSISGQLHQDKIFREVFSSSACLYRIVPQAVVEPKTEKDLKKIVEFCLSQKIPITARGAGSAVAGQALGEGLIVSFTKFFNKIIEINPDEQTVIVEPGVIYSQLNQALFPFDLFFPPDPSSGDYCTIGGMVANNSSGAHSLFYGSTQDYIDELDVILSDGSKVILGKNKFEVMEPVSDFPFSIPEQIKSLFEKYKTAIIKEEPKVKNSSGYLIWKAWDEKSIDFARLLAGSEGTLALITKIKLRLKQLPHFKQTGLFFFTDIESATYAVLKLRELKPLAIEMMDKNFIQMVQKYYPSLKPLLDENAEIVLLCEFAGKSEELALEELNQAVAELEKSGLAYKKILAKTKEENERIWQVRRSASPILYRTGQGLVRFIEDIVIPPEKLPQGIKKLKEIFEEFKTSAPFLGHAGEGNLHLNPKFNLFDKNERKRMQEFADLVYQAVIELGGSISGEHGDGILRAPYVSRQYPGLYGLFVELKKLFDPENIFNPGKILAPRGKIPVEPSKYWIAEKINHRLQERINQSLEISEIFKCHGCGLCRSYCPAVVGFDSELALPRSKASIARALAQGVLEENVITTNEFRLLLDSCYSCQRCLTLCPTGVEIPRILAPVKECILDYSGFSLRQLILEKSGEALLMLDKIPASFTELALSSPAQFVLDKLGINTSASGFVNKKDIRILRQKSKTTSFNSEKAQSLAKILYFPGCLEKVLEPEIKEKTFELLKELKADIKIFDELCCGMPSLSAGNWTRARRQAERLYQELHTYLAQGFLLLTNCPSCLLMFRYYYPLLLKDKGEEIAHKAKSIFELGFDFCVQSKSSDLIYHRACHIIALGERDLVLEGLTKAGAHIKSIVELCCGSGGIFELKKENSESSKRISLALQRKLKEADAELVVSACGLCRRKIRSLGFKTKSPLEIIEVKES